MSERKAYEGYVADARRGANRTRLASNFRPAGNLSAREGSVTEATKYLQESKQIYHALGERSGEAQACFNLDSVYDVPLQDDYNAIRYLREGLALDPTNDYYHSILS